MDSDQDGWISIQDIRVAWKKFLQLDLSEEDAQLFWFRAHSEK